MKKITTTKLLMLSTSVCLLLACANTNEEQTEVNDTEETENTTVQDNDNIESDNDFEESESDETPGQIEETEQAIDNQPEENQGDGLSNMTEEERHDHYQSLLASPEDSLDQRMIDYLELRGVHENTVAYGGRVQPGSTLELELYNRRLGFEVSDSIHVNEDGFFSINLDQYDKVEGDELNMHISHDDFDDDYHFVLPFHSTETGMDVIKPLSDTSEFEEQLLSDLALENIPNVYPTTLNYRGSLGRDLEGFFYSVDDVMEGNTFMQYSQRDNTDGDFIVQPESTFETGQIIRYHVLADGVIASTEEEVLEMTQESEEAAEVIRNNTDIELSSDMEGDVTLQTIPDAEIDISIINQWGTRRVSDENGEFELNSIENHIEPGISYFFTIRDENGYTETIEVEVN